MKYLLLVVNLFIFSISYGQETLKEYVMEGIEHHDAGNYESAIESYKKAPALDGKSALAHYEIALSYNYARQYENALKHANIVLDINEQFLTEAYVAKGNSLDALGRSKEAIAAYKKGLRKLGSNYMLHYNLGLTYYNSDDADKAQESVIKALNDNPNHAGSHLLLGHIMNGKGNKSQSMMSMYYFLFLEPRSGRSAGALDFLQNQYVENVKRTGPTEITLMLNPASSKGNNEFGPADMMITMLGATKDIDKKKGISKEEKFISNSESFFKVLGELKKDRNKGLWWDFYVPFFYEMAKTEHINTYCYYISQSKSDVALDWLSENEGKIESFKEWLSGQNN